MMESNPIYSLRVAEVYQALDTSPQGLPEEEAEARQQLYGLNLLAEPTPIPHWRKFILHTSHPMALLLWGAGILALIVREPVLAMAIWVLVLVNAIFSFWREYRTEQAMTALRRLLPAHARVQRNGVETHIRASQVVPGDILVLAEGDNIPADARVVEEYGLRTNNATLTGEAVPARKTADASFLEGISELERPNLIFAGTSVVSGTGRAVVYSTGMITQFGRIARLTQAVKEEPSPLQKELLLLTRRIVMVALGLGAIVFAVGAFDPTVGFGKTKAFLFALGILVAAVPEGLPATITLSLAMAGQRLARHGVLVKKLSIVETLGKVSIICTDKSGTLTQNQMTVREVWVAGEKFSVSGIGYEPHGSFEPDPSITTVAGDLKELLTAAMLCNNSRLNPPTPGHHQWSSLGDQTEAALRVAAMKGGLEEKHLTLTYPRLHELPFDARRKRMTTIHAILHEHPGDTLRTTDVTEKSDNQYWLQDDQRVAYVKGAPREVLQLCTHILIEGKRLLLNNKLREEIMAVNDEYAQNALRVLALARRDLTPPSGSPGALVGRSYSVERIERDLTFLGLMAMMDPPRPEVTEAIRICRQAGIRIVMITGDYGLTAESVARRVGMLSESHPIIKTGAELDELNDVQLRELLNKEVIYARMAPEHKLRLVAAFQEIGEVVAVTGDGVNDAPALRKADVGVAMGLVGTDVAKEAADIVITNDNFGAIPKAIEEGRAVFDNIRKFVTYIFSSNVPEILPFLLTGLLKLPLALNVQQILAIDLGTDLLPALALSTENPEPDVMNHPPRRRQQPLLDRSLLRRAFLWLGLIEALLCFGGFYLVRHMNTLLPLLSPTFPFLTHLGLEVSQLSVNQLNQLAMTVYFSGVVMAQVGNAFACRTEVNRGRSLGWLSNRFLWLSVGLEILMILLLIYFKPLADWFGHLHMPPVYWGLLAFYGLVLYSLDWLRKVVFRRSSMSKSSKM